MGRLRLTVSGNTFAFARFRALSILEWPRTETSKSSPADMTRLIEVAADRHPAADTPAPPDQAT